MTVSPPPPALVPDGGPPARHLQAVLGLVGYTCTVACTRYAKDADKAPAMIPRVELLRMSAEQVTSFERVHELAGAHGVDLYEASEGFVGALGDFDARLRPRDWPERLVKTYLAFGMLVDFSMALTHGLPRQLGTQLLDILGADRYGSFAADEIMAGIDSDSQLAGSLGLWARRVTGEEIGTLQRMMARFPELHDGGTEVEQLHAVLSQGAVSRMRGLGLRA